MNQIRFDFIKYVFEGDNISQTDFSAPPPPPPTLELIYIYIDLKGRGCVPFALPPKQALKNDIIT